MSQAGRIAELVGTLRDLVAQEEAEWRRRHLPPPSRDAPRPDRGAVQGAQTLEAVGRALDAIGGQMRTLPAPGPAQVSARHGASAPGRLDETDAAILAHVDFLLSLLAPGATAGPIAPDELHRNVAFLRELTQRRAELLV